MNSKNPDKVPPVDPKEFGEDLQDNIVSREDLTREGEISDEEMRKATQDFYDAINAAAEGDPKKRTELLKTMRGTYEAQYPDMDFSWIMDGAALYFGEEPKEIE